MIDRLENEIFNWNKEKFITKRSKVKKMYCSKKECDAYITCIFTDYIERVRVKSFCNTTSKRSYKIYLKVVK